MKKLLICALLLIALAALLTTGVLAFDGYNPPVPDAADGWYETADNTYFMDGSGEEYLTYSISYVNTFNTAGQLVKQVETDSNGSETFSVASLFEYDPQGRVVRIAEPDGNNEVRYDYRPDGSALQTYTWWREDETPDDANISLYTYDPQADWFWYGEWFFSWDANGYIARRWNDTEEEVYTNKYDDQGRLVESVVVNSNDRTSYTDRYTYQSDGGYTMREETRTGYEDFVYNAKGQLTRYVNAYSDPPFVFDYTYDDAGNCVKISGEHHRWEYAYEKGPTSFRDVLDPGSFYYEPVYWAVKKGITSGTSDTTFSPESPCTRAQVVTFLWRAAGSPRPKGNQDPFNDVKSGEYYFDAVLWAVENGITTGTSASTFSPDATCTRGQVVTFLWRYAGSPAPSSAANPFTDVTESDYFRQAVLWAVENSITFGTSATRFSPGNQCQRSHVVAFLYRSMEGK